MLRIILEKISAEHSESALYPSQFLMQNSKYLYIVHLAGLSIFPMYLFSFSAFFNPTIVGVKPQLTECGHQARMQRGGGLRGL